MSSPVWRTTSPELPNRRTSPSSAQIATAVTGPTPNWVARSAAQPGWWRDSMPSWRRSGSSSPVSRSICRSPACDGLPPGRGQVHLLHRGPAVGRGHRRRSPGRPGGTRWQRSADARRRAHRAGPYTAGPRPGPPARGRAGSSTRAGPWPAGAPAGAGRRFVGLGVPLPAAQRGGMGRLARCGVMPAAAAARARIASRCSLPARSGQRPARRTGPARPEMLPVSRHYPAALQLPGTGVQVLERELPAVHVECAYDAHEGPPRAPIEIGTWDLFPKPVCRRCCYD